MRPGILCVLLSTSLAAGGEAAALKGAGATTAAPLMAAWSKAYFAKAGDSVQYEAAGSVAGLESLQKGTVQFALSDAWVSVPELAAKGLVQFPIMVEGIVPVVNLPGVAPGALKLTGALLADIFLGKLKTWNDAAIAAANPGLALPALPISVLHRSDGSGSTFLLTAYLSAVSPAWKQAVGSGTQVTWPVGSPEAGSDGIVQKLKSSEGTISYVDFGHVRKQALNAVTLRNKDGAFVAPSAEGFEAAAASAPWAMAPAFTVLVVDQPGKNTWPISGAVFAVMRHEQADAASGLAILRFFDFALGDGAQIARDVGHVPLPVAVTRIVREAWPRLVKTSAGVSVWPATR